MHTHCSQVEGGGPSDAFKPCAFTLSICAHQLHEDIVCRGGMYKTWGGNSHFILHHFGYILLYSHHLSIRTDRVSGLSV